MLTPAQIRAARAMVGWSRDDLAKRSGVSAPALRDFEKAEGGSDPRQGTVHKWQRALEEAGVQFIDADEVGGPGVRLRVTKAKR
jgi:predicted transcriptional regulator